jgi:hypothetical protein
LGAADPVGNATYAYRSVGAAMAVPIHFLASLLASNAQTFVDRVMLCLCLPYQGCAFAGAYIMTTVIGLSEHILTTAKTYF